MIDVKILLKEGGKMPIKMTDDAACFDIFANIDEKIILKPMQRFAVPCGFSVEIPKGYVMDVRGRSGLSFRSGITIAMGVGTIDPDYRGEIHALLINLSDEDFEIRDKDRIAQILFLKTEEVNFTEVKDLSETDRGEGRFGSTDRRGTD